MNVTALIAEDEGPQRRALARLLASAWPELRIVAECANGTSALAALEAQRPTIAFLDIRMAGKDGIAVAQQAGPSTQVVFTTAYDQHAVRAFELGAVDYILKPVTAERLEATLDRLRARLAPMREDSDAPSSSPGLPRLSWITASIGNQVKFIAVENVLFFQACESCTRVVTATEEAIIRTPLREILKRVDPDAFWQIHRSFIVQLSAIAAVRRNELGKLEIDLRGCGEVIPVSQSFQSRFRGM
jgi:DNA-binding LytR/AlgR family response regulator